MKATLLSVTVCVLLSASCIRVVPMSDLQVIAAIADPEVKTGNGAIINAVAARGWPPYVYRWASESMPSGADLEHTEFTSQTVAIAEFPAAGEYLFRVTATDSRGARAIDYLRINVIDPAPAEDFRVRIAGSAEGTMGQPATLTAETTFEGDISFEWEIVSGQAELSGADTDTAEVTPLAEGEVVVRVTMTNNQTGAQRASQLTIRIFQEGELRVAIRGRDTTEVGLIVQFTAEVTNGGSDLGYSWTKVSGPGVIDTIDLDESGSQTATFTSTSTGESVVAVTVTDNESGFVATDEFGVRIIDEIVIPTFFAEIGDPFFVDPGERTTIDRGVETFFGEDFDESLYELSYAWSIASGGGVLEDEDAEMPTLTAPTIPTTTHLSLVVTATTIGGRQATTTDNLYVVVLPAPHPVIVFEFEEYGTVRVELDSENFPITVANFLSYVDEGFHDGLTIHRVETRQREGTTVDLVQGGGYKPENVPPAVDAEETHDPIPNENQEQFHNTRGTISMARTPDAHSATSQFFFNLSDNSALFDRSDENGFGYPPFGRVIEGIENLDDMLDHPTEFAGGIFVVTEPIIITSVRRE
jgi:cyclophilin family peptidyl-prolyl cis-trans isomerase